MRISKNHFAIGAAIVPLALVIPGVALADPPPPGSPPPPTGPAYVCDQIMDVQPAVMGYTNCEAFGGMKSAGWIDTGKSYKLIPRKAGSGGGYAATDEYQAYTCSGGYVDAPTSVAPKKCSDSGPSVAGSVAPSPIPYGGPGGVTR
jgi:hypothetical protein